MSRSGKPYNLDLGNYRSARVCTPSVGGWVTQRVSLGYKLMIWHFKHNSWRSGLVGTSSTLGTRLWKTDGLSFSSRATNGLKAGHHWSCIAMDWEKDEPIINLGRSLRRPRPWGAGEQDCRCLVIESILFALDVVMINIAENFPRLKSPGI